MSNEETRLDFVEKHAPRALCHYVHAKEKHPYFCDMITCLSGVGADTHLELARGLLTTEIDTGNVEACDVLMCEFYEAIQAYTNGDKAQAVDELYDAIAVCLRAIDVLEGRQKLGKPEEGGARCGKKIKNILFSALTTCTEI